MKSTFINYCLFILLFAVLGCSDSANNANQIHFTFNPEDRKLVLPLLLNDSITVNMVFDSGANLGSFNLDSTFCANHPDITRNILPIKNGYGGSAWSNTSFTSLYYDSTPKVSLGYFDLNYETMRIYDRKGYFNNPLEEGMFNIPKNDTTHVWELNFENNYLEIHPIAEFEMPENCLVVPIEIDEKHTYPFNIKIPIFITCANGDTITLNRTFTIDTGMAWDIALMSSAKEINFFNEQDDAVWIGYLANSYFRYYTVDARIWDRLDLDSLRIYTFNHSNRVKSNYLVGLNFLKRFNVFFDMKNQQIGLQPIKNFERIVNPLARRFHVSITTTPQGRIFVNEVGDYKTNYYKTAGFQKGDEIININGKLVQTFTRKETEEFQNQDSLVFDIIRDKKPQKIVVYVDKNEEKGD